jgi:hypothetical protein
MKKTLLFLSIFIAGNVATISHAAPSLKDRVSNAASTAWKYKEPALAAVMGALATGVAGHAVYEMIASGSLEGFEPEVVRACDCVEQYMGASPFGRAITYGFFAPVLLGGSVLLAHEIRCSNQ